MCIIIDNNVVHRVFFGIDDPDFSDLKACLFGNGSCDVKLVYGGGLKREYVVSARVASTLRVLDQAGRAIQVADATVDRETQMVENMDRCTSDDPHVVALARVSNVRLLCSHDTSLHADFKNPQLVNRPRGSVYQNPDHNHLLQRHCG
jgi:hypothetical protein